MQRLRVLQGFLPRVLRLRGEPRQVRHRYLLRFPAGGEQVRLPARTRSHGHAHAAADGHIRADRNAHGEGGSPLFIFRPVSPPNLAVTSHPTFFFAPTRVCKK